MTHRLLQRIFVCLEIRFHSNVYQSLCTLKIVYLKRIGQEFKDLFAKIVITKTIRLERSNIWYKWTRGFFVECNVLVLAEKMNQTITISLQWNTPLKLDYAIERMLLFAWTRLCECAGMNRMFTFFFIFLSQIKRLMLIEELVSKRMLYYWFIVSEHNDQHSASTKKLNLTCLCHNVSDIEAFIKSERDG